MLTFHTAHRPLTSRPFLASGASAEYRPCGQLRPYVSCYWTMDGETEDTLIIPDTCMDIIVWVNHTKQTAAGYLCGIQDRPFWTGPKNSLDQLTSFAVRFYFWSAGLFLKRSLKDTCNGVLGLEELGKDWEQLIQSFLIVTETRERIELTEEFLMQKLDGVEINSNLFNAVGQILHTSGRASVKDLCAYSCVSQRQMERLFLRDIGLPLKRVANLVRYQNVWRDMITSDQFDIQNAVYRYGYTDQAHLLNEFRRFHGVSPEQARRIADASR